MTSKYEALKKEVIKLEKRGKQLYLSKIHECEPIDDETLALLTILVYKSLQSDRANNTRAIK